MRVVESSQTQLGDLPIADIQFNIKSRDDIPQLLRGLQFIYVNDELRRAVFTLLESHIQPDKSNHNGRPGMHLWSILVMGVLRLDLNWDYDRLHEQVNNHKTIRQMLGHADFFDTHEYQLQTLKDNVHLLTPELLDEINQVVVASGHAIVKKKEKEVLRGRCDSFVVETNVHYPTDINILFDAMRKVITLTARLCEAHDLSGWRQHAYNIRQVKKRMRIAQLKKRGGGKTKEQKARRQSEIVEAHRQYIDTAQAYLTKARSSLDTLIAMAVLSTIQGLSELEIRQYMIDAERQIDQIQRRVIQGETIPHVEKVFSIFEPHTEWIVKGKAGISQELGLRVCIMEDHHRFLLHHRVMKKQTDELVAVLMVSETKARFSNFSTCSFDKGFHTPDNQTRLREILEVVALPRKGKRSKKVQALESSTEFQQAHNKHSAVESAINALEVHGLDRCPDHGIAGFERYVALSIVARNLQRIGAILTDQERARLERRRKKRLKQAA
jgi:hypothetical protein